MFDWLLNSSYRGIISSVLGMLAGFCAAILLNSAVSTEKLFTLSLLVSVIVFVLVHFILETYTKQELVYEKDWVSVYNRKIDFSDTFSLTWVTKSQNRVTLTPSTMLTKALFEELKRYSSGDLVCKVTHKQSAVVDLKNLDSYLTKVEYKKLKGYRNRLGFLRGDVQEFEIIKGVLRLTFEQEKAETIFD